MQMSGGDINTYKKFHQYVSVAIPEVAKIDVIIKSIQKFSGTISMAKIKEALEWGKGPMIKIVVMDDYGQFSPGQGSQEIRLQKAMIEDFEKGKGLRKTTSGKLVYLAGVTILHELTHWADDQDGVDTEGEEGEHFERAIYGKIIV
jgi:hypothetical protein